GEQVRTLHFEARQFSQVAWARLVSKVALAPIEASKSRRLMWGIEISKFPNQIFRFLDLNLSQIALRTQTLGSS
ncbi:MAG: hypothetical protein AAF713_20015, partial [Pseudomonadota bacterium]